MEDNYVLNHLSCSTFNEDQHVLKEPIGLDCGHCICKSCIPQNETEIPNRIKCNKCGELTDRDLNDAKPLIEFEKMLEMGLSGLYAALEKQTSKNIAKLKSLMSSGQESIELNVKYIEKELEIRVESLKIELDKLLETFKLKLEAFKKDIKQKISDNSVNELKINEYDDKLKELRDYLERGQFNKDQFYNHQDALRDLKKEVKQLESSFKDLQLEFTPSSRNLVENLIGEIHLKKKNPTPNKMKEILETNEYETITMNKFYDNIVLKNKHILCTTVDSLDLYDDNFNLVKNITEYGNKEINPFGITCDDDKSKIYISDWADNRIIMMDFELNFIKSFGSRGTNDQQLKRPKGLTFNNGNLYVCDCRNKRIQILTASDLQYVDSIKLDFNPSAIKISKDTIGIESNEGIYFYDLNTKMIKAQYPRVDGRLNLIASYFYVVSNLPKITCYVYDSIDGSLVDEININRFSNRFEDYSDGHITILGDYLLIRLSYGKELFKFEMNKE